MKNLIFLCTFLSFACGKNWSAEQPFRLQVDSPEIPAVYAKDAFEHAITQLGGKVTDFGTQVIHIKYDDSCPGDMLAHVDPLSSDTIQICARALLVIPTFKKIVMHETGHALGQPNHLPPCTGFFPDQQMPVLDNTHNIMCERVECYLYTEEYTAADIAFICAGGRVNGGICGK